MNRKSILITVVLITVSMNLSQAQEAPTPQREVVLDYLKSRINLKEEKKTGLFTKFFPGVRIYKVWREEKVRGGTSRLGMGLFVVQFSEDKNDTGVFSTEEEIFTALLKKYPQALKDEDAVLMVFNALTPVEEVVKVDEKTYHIFTGKKFFKSRSGYILEIDPTTGKVEECQEKLKLAPSKS